jgi:hypothetical protein
MINKKVDYPTNIRQIGFISTFETLEKLKKVKQFYRCKNQSETLTKLIHEAFDKIKKGDATDDFNPVIEEKPMRQIEEIQKIEEAPAQAVEETVEDEELKMQSDDDLLQVEDESDESRF